MKQHFRPSIRGSRTVVVAVTGHTHFDGCSIDAINHLVGQALLEIKQAAKDSLNVTFRNTKRKSNRSRQSPASPQLAVISCLAAGADQIVAQKGLDIGYKLRVVLPGAPDQYRQAIKIMGHPQAQQEARAMFDCLLGNANGIADLAMPLPAGEGETATRHAAYAAATKYMLQHCDLLIAIVDVLNPTNLGATGEAIRTAIRAGRPVVWIDPTRPTCLRWLSHLSVQEFNACEIQPFETCFVPDIAPDELNESSRQHRAVACQKEAPEDFVAITIRRKVHAILAGKREAVRYLAEQLPPCQKQRPAGLWNSLIEQWLPTTLPFDEVPEPTETAWPAKLRDWLRQVQAGWLVIFGVIRSMWTAAFEKLQKLTRQALQPGDAHSAQPTGARGTNGPLTDRDVVDLVDQEVESLRRRAEDLAVYYAGAHRSSFLTLTLSGVLAVALASFPAAFLVRSVSEAAVAAQPATAAADSGELTVARFLTAGELAIMLGMLAFYFANRALRFQEKSINYRLLSERFRNASALLLVGSDWLETSALPVQYNEHQLRKTWVEPFFQRSITRTVERLEQKLKDQSPRLRFNDPAANATYLSACREFIETRWLTVQAKYHQDTAAKYEALNLALEAIQTSMVLLTIIICLLHLWLHFSWLNFFASVLPAVGGAMASLAGQAELVRLRDRSLSMHRSICRRLRALDQSKDKMTADSLRTFVETTAQNMLGEVIEWRVLFKFRPIRSPA